MTAPRENTKASFRGASSDLSAFGCRHVRAWLFKVLASAVRHSFAGPNLSPQADWVQHHAAACPRCQRRLAAFGKVDLALSTIKSQPHKLDLLMRANSQAAQTLKRSLREAPKAMQLKTVLPEPKILERCARYRYSVANVAACIAILLLIKIGVFSSMERFQTRGSRLVQQYYSAQLGQDMADEVFKI